MQVVAVTKSAGGLSEVMRRVEEQGSIQLQHIESREAKHREGEILEILIQMLVPADLGSEEVSNLAQRRSPAERRRWSADSLSEFTTDGDFL